MDKRFVNNTLDLLKVLIERGLNINITFENDDSFLDVVILYENEAILQYLFEIGADIRSIHNIMEKVYFVISKDNVNILNILINNHLNIYEKDKNGDSVLLYAYKFFHNNIIHYLEHQKPDFINLTNNNKKSN
jgi:ankyrin repeat protein